MSTIDEEIEKDNLALRVKYLSEVQCYTADQIQKLASKNSNDKIDYALVWKNESRIFSVNDKGENLYPSFQFENGQPLQIVEHLLSKMPDDMTDWQIAFWFAAENGYIQKQKAPQNALKAEEDLYQAVEVLSEEIHW